MPWRLELTGDVVGIGEGEGKGRGLEMCSEAATPQLLALQLSPEGVGGIADMTGEFRWSAPFCPPLPKRHKPLSLNRTLSRPSHHRNFIDHYLYMYFPT
jgi:hypothetical protein